MTEPSKEAVTAIRLLHAERGVRRPPEIVVAELEAALPIERERWEKEVDARLEAIKWPTCPNDHPDPSAWIAGRDAAMRAFIQATQTIFEKTEDAA